MKKFVVMISAVMLMASSTISFAAMAGSNTVNSAAIVDGSIATADLANKAVTAAKIADATITATQLANGAVTATKLAAGAVTNSSLIDGSVTTSKIASGAVTGSQLAFGAVDSTKISGVISTDKLANYDGYKVVHTGPADNVNTFNSVQAAINYVYANISQCSSECYANGKISYLIKIMPGIYSENITLYPKIDLVGEYGAGGNTAINGTLTTTGLHDGNVVQNLQIWGLVTNNIMQLSFKNVFLTAGINNVWGNVTIDNSTVSGQLIMQYNGQLSINNSSIYEILNNSTVGVQVRLSNSSIYYITGNFSLSGYAFVNTQFIVDNQIPLTAGSLQMLNCYDNNLKPIPNR